MYEPHVGSVYDLASRITRRCSGMFYQDWHDDDYHFLDMFEHSIGDLVCHLISFVGCDLGAEFHAGKKRTQAGLEL